MKPYVVMMGMNLLALSCWTAIAPLTYKRYDAVGTDDWNRVISTYGICTSESESKTTEDFWPFLGVILAINISLLGIANVQAYQARSIQTEYSESRYIFVIMTSMMQMFALAVPCISLLSKQPRPYFIVMVIVILCVSAAVLGFMFLPKILHTRSWMIEQAEKEKVKAAKREKNPIGYRGSLGDDGLKVAVMSPANFNITKASCEVRDTKESEADSFLKQPDEGVNESKGDESNGVSGVKFSNSMLPGTANLEPNDTQYKEDNIDEEKEEIADDQNYYFFK
jgi:hypothetical protein